MPRDLHLAADDGPLRDASADDLVVDRAAGQIGDVVNGAVLNGVWHIELMEMGTKATTNKMAKRQRVAERRLAV